MANMRRDLAKERGWRATLKRQAASGLSVRGFCRREKLAESAFYAWRRIVAAQRREGCDNVSHCEPLISLRVSPAGKDALNHVPEFIWSSVTT